MNNQCPVLSLSDSEPCKPESAKQQLYIQEVETEAHLQKLPLGVIGILSMDIIKKGLHQAITEASENAGITLLNADIPFKRAPPTLPVIDHVNMIIDPYARQHRKVKSSKGKVKYQSNFTPKKKKRSKRK